MIKLVELESADMDKKEAHLLVKRVPGKRRWVELTISIPRKEPLSIIVDKVDLRQAAGYVDREVLSWAPGFREELK